MKSSFSSKFTVLAAAMIIAVFTWEQLQEKAAIEEFVKENRGLYKMTYDGGWTREFAMILCGIIVGIQIYSEVLAKKK